MKRHSYLYIVLLYLAFFCEIIAQNLNTQTELDSLNNLAFKNRRKNPALTLKLAQEVFKKARLNNLDSAYNVAQKNKALGFYYSGKLDSAITNELKTLKLFESRNEDLNIAGSLNRLGLYFRKNKDYLKAIEYYTMALDKFRILGSEKSESSVLNNLAVINTIIKKFDKASFFYNKSLEIKQKLNDYKGIARIYNNLGNLYFNEKKYLDALNNYTLSKELKQKLKDTIGIINCYNNISAVYTEIKKTRKSIENSKKALILINKINNNQLKLNLYNNLTSAYQDIGDYYNTFEYFHLHTLLKDSLYSIEKDKQIAQIREEYETEKKDQQISNQQLEIEKSETEKLLLISLVGFVTISLVLIAVAFFTKKKANRVLKEQKRNIEKINKELEAVNKTKDKLFSIIAHDIRSPIISLQNMTDLMDDYLNANQIDQYMKTVPEINRSVKHLNLMMENLFNWSVSQRGQVQTNKTEFDLSGMVESCIELQKIYAEVKNISISINETDEALINADINMIRSVFNNLISNAIKFTPVGGKINIDFKVINSFVRVDISDSGCGMDEEKLNKIFLLDESKIKSGTKGERGIGLGMVITKEFLEKNDGTITVKSTPGKGTTFTVQIKLQEESDHQV